jgi:hypothetical protein
MKPTEQVLRLLITFTVLAAAGCDRAPTAVPATPAPVAGAVPARAVIAADPVASKSRVRVLETKNYLVTIDDNRPVGDFDSAAVSYHCVSKKSGHKITLPHGNCVTESHDGSPEKLEGYTFWNGDTQYSVRENGRLEVHRGTKVIVDETGTWRVAGSDKRT